MTPTARVTCEVLETAERAARRVQWDALQGNPALLKRLQTRWQGDPELVDIKARRQAVIAACDGSLNQAVRLRQAITSQERALRAMAPDPRQLADEGDPEDRPRASQRYGGRYVPRKERLSGQVAQDAIVQYLQEHGPATAVQLNHNLPIMPSSVEKALTVLRKSNRVWSAAVSGFPAVYAAHGYPIERENVPGYTEMRARNLQIIAECQRGELSKADIARRFSLARSRINGIIDMAGEVIVQWDRPGVP